MNPFFFRMRRDWGRRSLWNKILTGRTLTYSIKSQQKTPPVRFKFDFCLPPSQYVVVESGAVHFTRILLSPSLGTPVYLWTVPTERVGGSVSQS